MIRFLDHKGTILIEVTKTDPMHSRLLRACETLEVGDIVRLGRLSAERSHHKIIARGFVGLGSASLSVNGQEVAFRSEERWTFTLAPHKGGTPKLRITPNTVQKPW